MPEERHMMLVKNGMGLLSGQGRSLKNRSDAVSWPSLAVAVGVSAAAAAFGLIARPRNRGARFLVRSLSALGMAAPWVYRESVRPWHLNWGATGDELDREMPGDDIVPEPWLEATRAITINTSAERIWPWVTQMDGYLGSGWYLYDYINTANFPSIGKLAQGVGLQIGDIIPMSPNGSSGSGFEVVSTEENRSLVMAVRNPNLTVSRAIVLDKISERYTRLIIRVRFEAMPTVPDMLAYLFFEPADFIMTRKEMLGIKERAEEE